jgi:hypothetical protein
MGRPDLMTDGCCGCRACWPLWAFGTFQELWPHHGVALALPVRGQLSGHQPPATSHQPPQRRSASREESASGRCY